MFEVAEDFSDFMLVVHNEPLTDRLKKVFRPSQVCKWNGCLRWLYLYKTTPENKNPMDLSFAKRPDNKQKADFGTGIHNIIEEKLRKLEVIDGLKQEFPHIAILEIEKRYDHKKSQLGGTLDVLMEYRGFLTVMDIKTTNFKKMGVVRGSGSPDLNHWRQITIYARLAKAQRVMLYYVDRAMGQGLSLFGEPIKGYVKTLSKACQQVLNGIASGDTFAVEEYRVPAMKLRCRMCDLRSIC